MMKKIVTKGKQKQLKNDKEFEKFKKHIEARFYILLEHFLIDFVTIKFGYPMKQPADMKNNQRLVITIGYMKSYRNAYIRVFDEAFELYKRKEFYTLDRVVIHELNHLHVIPFCDLANDRFTTEKEIIDTSEELTETMTEYMVRYLKIKGKKKNVKKKPSPKKATKKKFKK